MILDFSQLILFSLLCASIHWLIARSEIAQPFWSRMPGIFGKLLACPACSGFWLGGIIAGIGWAVPVTLVNDALDEWSVRAAMGALLGVVMTPIVEGLLLWGLERSAITEPEEPEAPPQDAVITPVDNPKRRA